jgi:hypothetical protein
LILVCKGVDKWYEQKYLKDILNWLGFLKKNQITL